MVGEYRKKYRSAYVILFIMLAVTVIYILSANNKERELRPEKEKMERYLRSKYGKEFVIKEIDYYHPYLGSPKEIRGIAHPKDDTELVFDVRKFADGTKWFSDLEKPVFYEYNEEYLKLLWEKQESENVNKILNIYTNLVYISFPINDIKQEINGKTIDINEAKKRFKNKLSMHVTCGLFENIDTKDLDETTETVYSIIEKIKDKNFKKISLDVVYFDTKYKQDVKKDIQTYLDETRSYYPEMREQKIIQVYYKIQDINLIDKPSDILKYIEK
jgi:hypothetical protein